MSRAARTAYLNLDQLAICVAKRPQLVRVFNPTLPTKNALQRNNPCARGIIIVDVGSSALDIPGIVLGAVSKNANGIVQHRHS